MKIHWTMNKDRNPAVTLERVDTVILTLIYLINLLKEPFRTVESRKDPILNNWAYEVDLRL